MIEFKCSFKSVKISCQGAPTQLLLTLDGTREDNMIMAALQSMSDGAIYIRAYSEAETRPEIP